MIDGSEVGKTGFMESIPVGENIQLSKFCSWTWILFSFDSCGSAKFAGSVGNVLHAASVLLRAKDAT